MPFHFNMLLEEAGIRGADVRLLRHQPVVSGKRLADVWRARPDDFDRYQAVQANAQRTSFQRPYWAAFVGTWDGRTLFLGLYEAGQPAPVPDGFVSAVSDMPLHADAYDLYPTQLSEQLSSYAGRLYVDWGGGASGKRAWVQKAEAQNKLITELHLDVSEQPFPGLMFLAQPLSVIADAPPGWAQALAAARGVYLLTCPRDGSLYVGSAMAEGGFWSRWADYRANGHGGNVALRGREPSDFVVSILEVAGSADSDSDILAAEALWKRKLQSRELGLNRN